MAVKLTSQIWMGRHCNSLSFTWLCYDSNSARQLLAKDLTVEPKLWTLYLMTSKMLNQWRLHASGHLLSKLLSQSSAQNWKIVLWHFILFLYSSEPTVLLVLHLSLVVVSATITCSIWACAAILTKWQSVTAMSAFRLGDRWVRICSWWISVSDTGICTGSTSERKPELLQTGVEPVTFWSLVWMFYLWPTGYSWELRSLNYKSWIKFI